jgi:RNA polymerase sigma-70 factor, ECF subfamily
MFILRPDCTQASSKEYIFLGTLPSLEWNESDSQLMRRVAARDESALALLYDRYSASIYSLLRRILRDESAAEEIQQDVFLHLWRIASHFEPERGELRSWLLVIARNRAISFLRHSQPSEVSDLDFTAVSSAMPQDTVAAQNEFVTKIKGILAQLPAEQVQLFEMAYFDGMTHAEIAQSTGQPLGTVKTRLRSVLTSLRRAFES